MFAMNAASSTAEAGGYPHWGGYGYNFNYGCHTHVYKPYVYPQYYYQPIKIYKPIYPVYPIYGGCHW